MTRPPEFPPAVVAVDWSGARAASAQRTGICVALASRTGGEVVASAGRTRVETIELIERLPPPVVIGFDFSFGLPEWFSRERDCTTIADVWELAAREGDSWLAPSPPFWRTRCAVPAERRFRRCELRLPPAKSVFQLVGNGQVGAGTVRGMPLLARLRERGFAIWPFDAAAERTVVEIYPSRLRRLLADDRGRVYASAHERDAVESARVMWEHRVSLAGLPAATDPVTKIEGDVWMPS